MTVIAATISEGGHVTMAADSRTCMGSEYLDGNVKAWRLGAALVGVAGGSALYVTTKHFRHLSETAKSDEIAGWCAHLYTALRDAALAHGQVYRNQDGTESLNMQVLVATRCGLWVIHTDGSVCLIPRTWHAIGSGGAEARGALHLGVTPARAVHAAIALDSGCGGPVTVLELGPEDKA